MNSDLSEMAYEVESNKEKKDRELTCYDIYRILRLYRKRNYLSGAHKQDFAIDKIESCELKKGQSKY